MVWLLRFNRLLNSISCCAVGMGFGSANLVYYYNVIPSVLLLWWN